MSTVAIVVDSVDQTANILFPTASFEQSFGGVPGTFQFTVRDPDRTLSFATGVEISLEVDGVIQFGGYVTQVSMGHMAPAADASNLSTYDLRTWTLRGTDYNIIFDKRVIRNTADYLSYIVPSGTTDGEQLRDFIDNYSDCSDFTTTGIEDIATLPGGGAEARQQGTKLRDLFVYEAWFGAAMYYIDGSKNFIYVPYEAAESRWGFSDQPNNAGITVSPNEFQGATRGFRQVEAQEDGTFIVNDALIWGGSMFAGASGGTVLARVQDATSQSTYGRWQTAETHFGQTNFKIQDGVDNRANAIVYGPPGTTIEGEQKGLRYAQWQFTFTWFSVDVPLLSGVPKHLVAGDAVTIEMNVFGVTKLLPLRTLRTSFPDALVDGDPDDRVVQFDGTFGLQLGDPFTLWRYILANQDRVSSTVTNAPVAVNDSSTTTVYGAMAQLTPTPVCDGSTVLFTIAFGYVPGTLAVYLNGLLQRFNTDFTETDNVAGTFTMSSAPVSTDELTVTCITLDA